MNLQLFNRMGKCIADNMLCLRKSRMIRKQWSVIHDDNRKSKHGCDLTQRLCDVSGAQ